MFSRVRQNNLLKLVVVAIVIACLSVIVLGGCSAPSTGKIEVRVIVTQDFGNELMLDKSLLVSNGSSAMDALKQVAEVETAYDGGFVNAIRGVRSSAREGWFIIVNGILSNTGACDYTLHSGDVERWDFHN